MSFQHENHPLLRNMNLKNMQYNNGNMNYKGFKTIENCSVHACMKVDEDAIHQMEWIQTINKVIPGTEQIDK